MRQAFGRGDLSLRLGRSLEAGVAASAARTRARRAVARARRGTALLAVKRTPPQALIKELVGVIL